MVSGPPCGDQRGGTGGALSSVLLQVRVCVWVGGYVCVGGWVGLWVCGDQHSGTGGALSSVLLQICVCVDVCVF